ncbi:MAG: hypothetical protein Q7S96_04580 [bacterium]|nr:hypothetical protein [bacterium]
MKEYFTGKNFVINGALSLPAVFLLTVLIDHVGLPASLGGLVLGILIPSFGVLRKKRGWKTALTVMIIGTAILYFVLINLNI